MEPLGPAERRAWARDGFFVRRRILGADALAALRDAADRVEAEVSRWRRVGRGRAYRIDGLEFRAVGATTLQYEHAAGSTHLPRVLEPVHPHARAVETLIDDPRLATPAAALVGGEGLSVLTDKLNWKRPHTGSAFAWHQDAPYWAGQPGLWPHLDRLANVLLALDDADEDNGCFRVRVGSHRHGALPARCGAGTLDPLFLDPAALAPFPETALPLEAGSAVFFHACLAHGSRPNRSPRPRRALVLTYQPSGLPMLNGDRVRNVAPPPDTRTRR